MHTPPDRRPPSGCRGLGLLLLLGACAVPAAAPAPAAAPPAAALVAPAPPAAFDALVITADRRASEAGLAMLARGGAPIDAAVAAQAVLGLVEPQASGFGGGSVLLLYRAADGTLSVIDGTPRAGRDAPRGLTVDAHGHPLDPASVAYGGGAVGVPGTLPALAMAHKDGGKLPWAELFAPAIALAEGGFAMPRALHDLLALPNARRSYGEAAAPFLLPDGSVPAVGALLRHPAYAATLRRIAAPGPLFDAATLADTLAVLRRGANPSHLVAEDFDASEGASLDAPVCAPWRAWKLCAAGPPSFGGLVALQIVGIAGAGEFADAGFAHRFLDAGRLAEADRRRFVADPEFVAVPTAGLLDPAYLASRAALIPPAAALPHPKPGEPAASARRDDPGAPTTATSQIVVVAKSGDALSMTSSLTHLFGARVAAAGVVLNNALVNFSPAPPDGVHYANEMAPDKRPVTPAAPVAVLDNAGKLLLLGGSGGGAFVPDVVAQALIEVLGNRRAPAEALARPHLSSADPDHVAVEAGTTAETLLPALTAMGYRARADRLASGSAFAWHGPAGWVGAADPRRDGAVAGE